MRRKILAGLLFILILVGGVIAGVILSGQQQIFKQKASGGCSSCIPSNSSYSCTNGSPVVECGSSCTVNLSGNQQGCFSCDLLSQPHISFDGPCGSNAYSPPPTPVTGICYPPTACMESGSTVLLGNQSCTTNCGNGPCCYTCNSDGTHTTQNGYCGGNGGEIPSCSGGYCIPGNASTWNCVSLAKRQDSNCTTTGFACCPTAGGGGGTTPPSPSTPPSNICSGVCLGPTWTSPTGQVITLQNCGTIGYQSASGSCSAGQFCCQQITGPPPTPTPRLKICGETCTSDSQCQNPSTNGGTVRCIQGTCQNVACPPGKTIFGTLCDCSALNACGQPCSASLGLCQEGSVCTFVPTDGGQNVAGRCDTGHTPTYCVDVATYTNSTLAPICNTFNNTTDHWTALTLNQIREACGPTPSPSSPPTSTACNNVKAHDTNWNLLSTSQLSQLKTGDVVRFTITGTTTSGAFDKARFSINGIQSPEVTTTRPGANQEFYYEYTIPAGVTSFTIGAQIHHAQLNIWI